MYRRRRVLATAGSAVLVILVVWAAGALLGSASADSVRGAANQQPAGVPLTSDPASNPPSVGTLPNVPGSPSSSSASASGSATPLLPPGPTSVSTVTVVITPPPQPCPDSAIQVTVTVNKPSFRVGQRPQFTLHITNTSPVACIRDVSRPLRSIVVVAAGSTTPLWTDTDCYAQPLHDVRTLPPNAPATYSVVWAGRTSSPGCPVSRTTVGAGQYDVIGHLGPLTGPPTPFTLTAG